jgi:hypothetical protein
MTWKSHAVFLLRRRTERKRCPVTPTYFAAVLKATLFHAPVSLAEILLKASEIAKDRRSVRCSDGRGQFQWNYEINEIRARE